MFHVCLCVFPQRGLACWTRLFFVNFRRGFTQEKWPRPKGFAAEGHWFFVQMQAEENILPEDPEELLDLGEISAILRQTAT